MYNRKLTSGIKKALTDTPIILVNGARQTGKSTLAKAIGQWDKAVYYTLDNASTLSAVKADPSTFIKQLNTPLIIDEVQRVPELFLAIKESVDNHRVPGQFLLTGSADIFLLPAISDSLAGRMQIFTLWPLSQGEIKNTTEQFVDLLFSKQLPDLKYEDVSRAELINIILTGGYPEVLTRGDQERREDWFESYLTAILQRDIRDYANIEGLAVLPQLLTLLAARAGTLLNSAELSRSSGIPQTTLSRYLTLLRASFLVHEVLPWSSNLSKRLVKSSKIYLSDTGLIGHLLGMNEQRLLLNPSLIGGLLENFVVNELKKQLGWNKNRVKLFHYRTQNRQEVDIVLENRLGECVGIEVKASNTISKRDFNGLIALSEHVENKFLRGIILYTGNEILPFADNLWAVPMSALWAN